MTVTYNHIQANSETLTFEHIERFNKDGTVSWIPIEPANADYQAYLNKDNPVEHFTPNV